MPSEIMEHLQRQNRQHFGKAHDTPFTTNHSQKTWAIEDSLLEGTYKPLLIPCLYNSWFKCIKQTHKTKTMQINKGFETTQWGSIRREVLPRLLLQSDWLARLPLDANPSCMGQSRSSKYQDSVKESFSNVGIGTKPLPVTVNRYRRLTTATTTAIFKNRGTTIAFFRPVKVILLLQYE